MIDMALIAISAAAALSASAGLPDLSPSPFRVIDEHLTTLEHSNRRSPYLLPEAELPTVDRDEGVEIKWRLKRIKVKVPLGAS